MAKIDVHYVKHVKGILKILQLVATCSAFACMTIAGNGLTYLRNDEYFSRYDFFLASHIIGCLVLLVVFLVHLFSLQDTLGTTIIWNYLNLVFCFLFAFLCGLSAGLMIVYAEREHQNVYFKRDYSTWRWYSINRIAAIACGFLSGFIHVIDVLVQLIELRTTNESN